MRDGRGGRGGRENALPLGRGPPVVAPDEAVGVPVTLAAAVAAADVAAVDTAAAPDVGGRVLPARGEGRR